LDFENKRKKLIIISFAIFFFSFISCLILSLYLNNNVFLKFYVIVVLLISYVLEREFMALYIDNQKKYNLFEVILKISIIPFLIALFIVDLCLRGIFGIGLI